MVHAVLVGVRLQPCYDGVRGHHDVCAWRCGALDLEVDAEKKEGRRDDMYFKNDSQILVAGHQVRA